MKPIHFVTAQFFLLSLAFSAFFDPIGISFALLGLVWIMNKRLAYAEAGLILFFKGFYGWAFASELWLNVLAVPSWSIPFLKPILPFEILVGGYYGATLAVKTSGKIMSERIKRKAPDLLGMIQK